ncbi:hypothetical protein ACSFBI_01460 [Variovorax sp. RB3P1]|uniref:hypothetical protein n=1 Tax=Variovorax sp. RB3P1 TaxID=3443732 RepID=UPI003F487F6D
MRTSNKALAKSARARDEGLTEADDRKLRAQVNGQMVTDTALNMGLVAASFSDPRFAIGDPVEVLGVSDALTVEIERVQAGDLSGVEAMLIAQAISLQNMAARLLSKAADTGTAEALNVFGGLGLRAQAQSRATLATLIDLKFPRATVFAKNANVANGGPQQVNMSGAALSGAPAREVNSQNKVTSTTLKESANAEVLDAGAARSTGRRHPTA